MSWLGEQLTSFTEKISDFTKEVLVEDSNLENRDADNETALSYKELLDLSKEKDLKINSLITEKEYLEKSIEELDQQHQEAIEALLIQKKQVTVENNDLKQKLTEKLKLENAGTDFSSAYSNSDLSNDAKCNNLENQCTELLGEEISLISILQSVSDSSEDEKFKKQIDWLEKQKMVICNDNTKKKNILINKINNYIYFLEALHNQSLYSVIDEICSIFNSILFENAQLKFNSSKNVENYPLNSNKADQCNLLNSNKCSKFSEAYSQTILSSTNSCHVASQTDHCNEDNSSLAKNSTLNNLRIENQFYDAEKIKEMQLREKQLQDLCIQLEQEKSLLKYKIELQESLTANETVSVNTQTDEHLVNNIQLELLSAQKLIQTYIEDYNVLEIKYNETVKTLKENIQSRNVKISLQEAKIETLSKKIISLEELVKNLKENLSEYQKNQTSRKNDEKLVQNNITLQKNSLQTNSFSTSEMVILQGKLKNSELEKGKLLSVLNEKTQECSSLKSEVHKLTNVVASEKQALLKLQQDNCNLKQSNEEKTDSELTKETIRKLSNLIKDKDLEIDSLKQKNSTLTTLIQSTSAVPEHMQALLEEKSHLSKQLQDYKSERDKIMLKFNNRDKEWREGKQQIKELKDLLENKKKEFELLDQRHCTISQQYEEKQKSLINAQSEIVILKQRVWELEQQLVDLKNKHSELINTLNSDTTIQVTKEELNVKDKKIEKLTCFGQEKDHLIQEKDCMIHDLSQQLKKIKLESNHQNNSIEELQERLAIHSSQFQERDNTIEQLQKEKYLLDQRLQDKTSELNLLKEINERLSMTVKEKEFSIQSMTEKISSLSRYIGNETSSPGGADINQILADSESMFSEAQKFRRERDESLLALNQSKQDNQSLRNEIQRMKSTEIHLENQLARLREHLLEVEENYTNEALKAEEREKNLKDELLEVKRRADITSTAVVDTNQRASIQIASLQEQLGIVANQRDEALNQVSSLEDKVLQHSTAVNKLRLVLEQIQKNNERKVKEIEHKWQSQLENQTETIKLIEKQLQIKQMQLDESSKALEAASRLSEQLDAKEEIIINLKKELTKYESKIKSTALEINSIKSNTEGKVDRVVMKSLVLGYFSTPPGQKSEVIRLLARVLDFNQEEMEKAGIVVGRSNRSNENKGLFSSIFNRLPSLTPIGQNSQQSQQSFTTLFVQFLENESQPIVPMPFPAEKMAQELASKSHSNKKSQGISNNSSPRRSPLLMDIDSAFPTFTPVPALEYSNSPAPSILKEVLE